MAAKGEWLHGMHEAQDYIEKKLGARDYTNGFFPWYRKEVMAGRRSLDKRGYPIEAIDEYLSNQGGE